MPENTVDVRLVLTLDRDTGQAIAVRLLDTPAAAPRPRQTQEQRWRDRLEACRAAGLKFGGPRDRLPRGIGAIAESLGISRPALAQDLQAALSWERSQRLMRDIAIASSL